MFGGLEGTEEELLYVDHKIYPRRKIETIQRLMEELDENDLKEWLIRDILKPRGKRGARKKSIHKAVTLNPTNVLEQFDKMLGELEPQNTIIEDFKSPAQKEFAVSEAIKEVKKRGRKTKYETEEERKTAKREKTLASNKRKREERMHAKDIQNQLDADEKSDEENEKKSDDDFPLNVILTPAQVVARKIAKANPKDPVEKYMQIHGVSREKAVEMLTKFGLGDTIKDRGSGIKKIVKTKLGEVVRGDVVAEVIRKTGLPLGEASRYVKLHNLY
jgi:hypothetical protein